MGVIDVIRMQARREGEDKAKEEISHTFVVNLIRELDLSDKQVADIVEVPMAFVKKVRKKLEAKK